MSYVCDTVFRTNVGEFKKQTESLSLGKSQIVLGQEEEVRSTSEETRWLLFLVPAVLLSVLSFNSAVLTLTLSSPKPWELGLHL